MAFEIAAGIVPPAVVLRLDVENDLSAFCLGAGVMAIDIVPVLPMSCSRKLTSNKPLSSKRNATHGSPDRPVKPGDDTVAG